LRVSLYYFFWFYLGEALAFMNCLGSVKRGSLFNLIGLWFGGKGRLLLLNCGLIVFEDFSPPQQRLGFLKEVLSEEERGGLLLFSSSLGSG
jgi:hypothetical protein